MFATGLRLRDYRWGWLRADVIAGVTVAAYLSVLVLGMLFSSARWTPRLPAPLLVMVLAAAVTALAGLGQRGVALIGAVPSGLPSPALPSIDGSDLRMLVLPALGVPLVGYTDTVLTGRAFASRYQERLDADAELLALGGANLTAGVLQGFPVSSSGSRTAVAAAAGAKSQVYSLVVLAMVIITLLFAGALLSTFPSAALGALVVYAAVRLIDLGEFRRIGGFRRSELILAVATCVGVVTLGVLYGVLVAVALSILDLLRRVARPHDGILGIAPGVPSMHDLDDYPQARPVPGLVVYRYDSPLFFANAEDFRRRALAAVDSSPDPVRWLLLNAEAIVEIDITAIDALESLRAELERRGIVLALARVKQDLRDDLEAADFVDRLGPARIFPHVAHSRRSLPGADARMTIARRSSPCPVAHVAVRALCPGNQASAFQDSMPNGRWRSSLGSSPVTDLRRAAT